MDDLESRQQLADLTVVVLTRNRPAYLLEVIKYWSRWPVTLLVLDGSDHPVEAASLYAGEARLILHSEISTSGRFGFAASRLNTPFACLHSDDDFTLARGAAQTIRWIKDNPEISCVASDVFMFSEDRTGFLWKHGRTVMSPVPNERVAGHFADYRFSYFYGIQRSKQLSIALSAVAAATECPEFIEYPSFAVGYEVGIEICGAALGQLSNWPDVLLLKRVGNETRWAWEQESHEWLEDPNAQAALRAWRSILSQHLAPHLNVSEAVVDGWITEAMQLYCRGVTAKGNEGANLPGLVNSFSRALRPKSKKTDGPTAIASTRFVYNTQAFAFGALRGTYRASMKILGRPRRNHYLYSGLDRADPRDVKDVADILDKKYHK